MGWWSKIRLFCPYVQYENNKHKQFYNDIVQEKQQKKREQLFKQAVKADCKTSCCKWMKLTDRWMVIIEEILQRTVFNSVSSTLAVEDGLYTKLWKPWLLVLRWVPDDHVRKHGWFIFFFKTLIYPGSRHWHMSKTVSYPIVSFNIHMFFLHLFIDLIVVLLSVYCHCLSVLCCKPNVPE